MGYSPQKKQLDLKEFLSQPAKKRQGAVKFGYRTSFSKAAPAASEDAGTTKPATETAKS